MRQSQHLPDPACRAGVDRRRRRGIPRVILTVVTLIFAAIGFFLTSGFIALRLGWTNVAGWVDPRSNRLQAAARKRAQADTGDGEAAAERILVRTAALCATHPRNATLILEAYGQHRDPARVERMLEALEPYLAEDAAYRESLGGLEAALGARRPASGRGNLFAWMDAEEWAALREAIARDREPIQDAARTSGVEARLIVAMMVGEQMRLHTSRRETFKQCFAPLRILVNETKFSLGVCGIKEETAKAIEANLRDPGSPFYPGRDLEALLDYPADVRPETERIRRLTDPAHRWSYLYAGLFLRQIMAQWKAAGYDLSGRPEILGTLFNIGFAHSAPGPAPQTGGARITIRGKDCSFGLLAYEFYHSGDLADIFPFPPPAARTAAGG